MEGKPEVKRVDAQPCFKQINKHYLQFWEPNLHLSSGKHKSLEDNSYLLKNVFPKKITGRYFQRYGFKVLITV